MTEFWLTSVPIAHRGLHDSAAGVPENSRAAFQAARAAGYGIELDVRVSSDGVAMVFHDEKLRRMLGREGRLEETSAAELENCRLLGTGETVPSLAAVLAQIDGRVPLLVEVKHHAPSGTGPAEATAAALEGYRGPVAVQSFSPLLVDWFRRRAPGLLRGQIATDRTDLDDDLDEQQRDGLEMLLRSFHGEPQFLSYNVNYLPSPLTEAARVRGLPVLTWTVRTPEQRARAAAHADNVIFEGLAP